MVDDHNPYFFLFGGLPNAAAGTPVATPSLTVSESVLVSQCGGQRANHIDQILSDAFPEAARVFAHESVSSSAMYHTFAPIQLPDPEGMLCSVSLQGFSAFHCGLRCAFMNTMQRTCMPPVPAEPSYQSLASCTPLACLQQVYPLVLLHHTVSEFFWEFWLFGGSGLVGGRSSTPAAHSNDELSHCRWGRHRAHR